MQSHDTMTQWKANYTQNVEKHLVHKAFNSEVFLTDSHRIDESTFEIAAFLPRAHTYFITIPKTLQGTMYLLYLRFLGNVLSWWLINFMVLLLIRNLSLIVQILKCCIMKSWKIRHKAINPYIKITILQVKHKRGNNYCLLLDMQLFIGSKKYATKIMDMSWFAPKIYEKLRGKVANENYTPLDNHQISSKSLGRNATTNVVITQFLQESQYFQTTIIPNQAHPAFFDHPLDHIPASFLIEALRQSSLLAIRDLYHLTPTDVYVSGIKIDFKAFCGLHNDNFCFIEKEHCIKNNNDKNYSHHKSKSYNLCSIRNCIYTSGINDGYRDCNDLV